MTNLFRSLVFVPGNNPRFLEKAKSLSGDIVCFDLEDSVPEKEKQNARTLISKKLKECKDFKPSVFVRTNSPQSGKIPGDLEKIVQKGLDGIVIPKVDSAKELKKIEKIISNFEKKRKLKKIRLIPSIESALGVINCYEIASASKRVDAIVFGIFDLLNDMQIEYTKGNPIGAKYSRYKIPVAAAAAGVVAIDGIWQEIKDEKGLQQDCKLGKELGYAGKSIIHPDQIKITHKIFHPNSSEISWSKLVVKEYEKSTNKGRGAIVVDGKMIDEVHYKRAQAILELIK